MIGHTLRNKIHNEDIRSLGVANIEEKMKENRLRWKIEIWSLGDSKRGRGTCRQECKKIYEGFRFTN